MRYKPDWPAARERLTALWEGRRLDRPCLAVTAPNGRAVAGPPPPANQEQRWLDPDWVVPAARAQLENTWWGGEAIPSVLLMAGWVVCFGGQVQFDERTIWHEPMTFDYDQPPALTFDPDLPLVQRHTRLYQALAAAAGRDDFLVGSPLVLPANDLLSMLMGPEAFLTNLVDHPDWMRAAIRTGARAQVAARQFYRDLIADRHAFWYGNAGWMPFWAPEPFQGTQSDVSCMVSPAAFEEFILPELQLYGAELGPLWYHLDGGDARQHLRRLLSLPYLRVLQYTPRPNEPPNGPAHLPFYRDVQEAGKIVHIQVPKEHIVPLARALDPARLMLHTACDSVAEGRALLEAVRAACAM